MTDDLVARLWARNAMRAWSGMADPDPLIAEAAARIEALEGAIRGVIERHDDYMAATAALRARGAMHADPLGRAVERARAALAGEGAP